MLDATRRSLEQHAEMVEQLRRGDRVAEIVEVAGAIAAAYRQGGKLVLFGNGGSAADAQHVAAEFTGRYVLERPGLPAIALGDNTAAISAIGNDYGFDQVFARQLAAFGRPGDVALGLSTSGASANVLEGIRAAREIGMLTVSITGSAGVGLAGLSHHCIVIPSADTPQVQEGTMLVCHLVCQLVEQELFG
ncbi:MAG: D-sedoheptulose-7-phosphate isomerase [Gaiellales bacterium]